MADSRALPAWRQRAFFALATIITATLLLSAALMMFSRFMLYDDEGYVLISLRNFAEHGRLYHDVYSQYGPLPYVVYYALNLVGVPLTHTAGRIATLVIWTTNVFLSAWIVWRLTRRPVLVLATIAGVFTYLWMMVNEPPHPGGLITLITAVLATIGGYWLSVRKERAWAALAGAGAAALMLTKINVGVFAAASAGAFLLLNFRHDMVRRWAPWAMGAAFALLPFALMRQLLQAEWIQTYALVFSLSGAAAVGAAAAGSTPRFGGREIIAAIAGAAGVGLVVVLVMMARGTTPADLLQGVLLGPLHHPVSFNMAFKWGPGARLVAVLSAAIFVSTLLLRKKGRMTEATTLVAVLRLAAAAGLIAALVKFPGASADNFVLAYGISCLWLFAWPLTEKSDETSPCAWIALLQLGQFLHPFPVPGSQIGWGTFLSLPLVATGAWQAAAWLAPRLPAIQARIGAWSLAIATGLTVIAGYLTVQFAIIGNQYFDGRNLSSLAGAEPVRLPDESTARYQLLCFNALAHSDMLFSLPGMFSFNLWTGLPTPTYANVTHWFSLLTPAQQEEIIRVLESHPRAVLIVDPGHVDFLRRNHLAPAGPLYDYIERTFVPAFMVDHFEFRVRKGRHIAPFFTGELFKRPTEANNGKSDSENTRIAMPLLLPADQAIGSIELLSRRGLAPPLTLRDGNVRIEVTPITPQGDARGPTETRTLPLKLQGAASVALYFDGKDRPFGLKDTLVVLRSPTGVELGLVRLRP